MVVGELLGEAAAAAGEWIGLNGLAVTALAVSSIGLFYLHEAGQAFAALSRWAKMLSYTGIALTVSLVLALQFGLVDLTADGSVIGSLLSVIEGYL